MITGVDIEPQPRYPFEFVQGDAIEYLAAHGSEYDFIHASPECQGYTVSRFLQGRDHERYIPQVRQALEEVGKPYIIENVEGAKDDLILERCILLCGVMFGLKVFRHRYFELPAGWLPMAPPHEPHGNRRAGKNGFCSVVGHGDQNRGRVDKEHRGVSAWRSAMGIDWMTRDGLAQAIPPAYTEYAGRQMFSILMVMQ